MCPDPNPNPGPGTRTLSHTRVGTRALSLTPDLTPGRRQAPERILDAPELLDDYYLNLLDWGKNNVLAVALGDSIYLWAKG